MKLIIFVFTVAAALLLSARASAQWPAFYDYETSVDWGNKIAVDHHGNVYIAGTDYSSSGELWRCSLGTDAPGVDRAAL